MSGRVWAFVAFGLVVFVLAVAGLFAIFNWITSSRNAPGVAQQAPAVQVVDTPTPVPVAKSANTPTPAPSLVPCGDGTFAPTQADCDRANEQRASNTQSEPAAQPAEVPEQSSQADPQPPGNGCTASPDNAQGGSPQLSVAQGHRLSVQWFYDEQTQQQSVLEAGVYQPLAGVKVGASYDYPDCPRERVEAEAVASNGFITDFSNGFSKVG